MRAAAFTLCLAAFCARLCAGAPETIVPAQQYVNAARQALQHELRTREGRVEISVRGEYRDLRVSTSGAELRTRASKAGTSASALVWVEVLEAGRVTRRVPVAFKVTWFKPALVACAPLEARAALTPEMFSLLEVDVMGLRGEALDNFSQLEGKRLKHAVSENVAIGFGDIEERPPVQAGDFIRVVATVGKVHVHRVAIAQTDGFPGQRIRARVEKDNAMLRVEVIGAGAAKVVGDG